MASSKTLNSNQSPPAAATPSDSTSIDLPLSGELDGEIAKLANNAQLSLKGQSPKQIIQNQLKSMRSWGSFFDTSRMRTPTSTVIWSRRLVRNIEFFQANYICIFLVLVIYCILTSPLLLFAIAAALGACYIVTLRNRESPIKILNYQLSTGQIYLAIAVCSFPLFWLAGAGSAVFWVLGASFFVVCLHASIYAIEMAETGDIPFQVLPTQIETI